MSQTNSPWGDKSRLNALRENLVKPYEYTPNFPIFDDANRSSANSNDDNSRSTERHNSRHSTRLEKNTITSVSPISNVKTDPQLRKWRNFYASELRVLYDLFISELKKITFETKEKLENNFDPNNFYFFIYKHTSPGLRKI